MTEEKREKRTVKKEVKLDEPKQVSNQVQVHRGNIEVLTLKFDESKAISLNRIATALEKIAEKLK